MQLHFITSGEIDPRLGEFTIRSLIDLCLLRPVVASMLPPKVMVWLCRKTPANEKTAAALNLTTIDGLPMGPEEWEDSNIIRGFMLNTLDGFAVIGESEILRRLCHEDAKPATVYLLEYNEKLGKFHCTELSPEAAEVAIEPDEADVVEENPADAPKQAADGGYEYVEVEIHFV